MSGMKDFLKLTRRKIKLTVILTVLIVIACFVLTVLLSFYGLNNVGFGGLPCFTPNVSQQNPHTFQALVAALQSVREGCPSPEYYSPLVQLIVKGNLALSIALFLLFVYLLSCTLVFVREKRKKHIKKRNNK
jgi:hypothetical protein